MTNPSAAEGTQAGVFQVDFESLIKVLGENLYTDPKAAIRELIQNASDSCVRRTVEQQFAPAIHIRADREQRLLIVEDNGAGMVQEDVIRYLASIGAGRTREERQRLATSDQQAAQMLIGQFGIGFLSTFVVADRVMVDTCSFNDTVPVNWVCEGTAEYQIGRGKRESPGTQVTLWLKPAHYDLLEEDTLRAAVVRYADFIAFPIYVNSDTQPVNRMNAPWHTQASEAEYVAYIKHRYGVAPLALEPIHVTQDQLTLSGVLFIPPRKVEFKRRLRSADLFQKRMYVGEDLQILPEWAGFICAVIDCTTLDLVASREAVISERPSYRALQDYLGQAVTQFVRRLAERERSTFLEVIQQHDWPVLWGAIKNDMFFEQVKNLIPIPSDSGPLTIPTYLERVPARLGNLKTIYYVPSEQQLGQQQSSLFKARGVPVFQADFVFEQFLKKYVGRAEGIGLRQMVSGVVELMEAAEGPRWQVLETHYQELGIAARAVRFHPADMSAMVVRNVEYDQERLVQQIVDGSRSLLDFMGRTGRETSDAYSLCFNIDNPLMQRLATYNGDETVLRTALRAIYASALLAAGIELTPELSRDVANAQVRIIELLLEQASRLETGGTVSFKQASFSEQPTYTEVVPSPVAPTLDLYDFTTFMSQNQRFDDEQLDNQQFDVVDDSDSASPTGPSPDETFFQKLRKRITG